MDKQMVDSICKMADQSITELLHEFGAGDKRALDQVMPIVYAELRQMAANKLGHERDGHTLQPTALVNEIYVKLVGQGHADFRSRAHFFGIAANLMRQILIDHARKRKTGKRGGDQIVYSVNESLDASVEEKPAGTLEVDEALVRLERRDPLQARLIELRFFGGLTAEESAEVVNLPVGKVRAELRVAQAWLQRELDRSSKPRK